MGVFQFFGGWRNKQKIAALAQQIVQQHQEAFWHTLQPRLLKMGEAEALGYSRTKASLMTTTWVQDLLDQNHLDSSYHSPVQQQTIDLLVETSRQRYLSTSLTRRAA